MSWTPVGKRRDGVSMPDLQPYFVLDYLKEASTLACLRRSRTRSVEVESRDRRREQDLDGLYPPDAEWQGALDTPTQVPMSARAV